ncbi:MAG: histidine kinase dimerization/phosphoacceptor domain -containing protein [Flavobacteriaceae bacterium]
MNFFSYILLLFFSISVYSQNNIISIKQVDSLLQIIEKTPTDSEKVTLLSGYSGKYRYVKNTRRFINEAIEISEKKKNKELLAKAYYSLGNYHYYNTQLDSSLISLNIANNYINDVKNPLLKSSILNSMGGVYKKKGNISKSISSMLEAKSYLDKIDTLTLSEEEIYKFKGRNLVLNNSIANFYNQMEEYEISLSYYETAYQNALKLKSNINAGGILTNKGDLLLKMGNYNEALNILLEAKELKLKGNAPLRSIGNSELTIGIAYLKNGYYNEALKSYNKAFQIYSEIDNPSGLINTLTERGILFNNQKDYSNAKKDCETAKNLAIQHNDLEYQAKSCECLFEAYKGLGDFENALENHQLYVIANDSIFSEKNIKKFTQLQMQYDFDKQQEQQKLEAQEKELQRKMYLFFSVTILIIALLLGFFFVKNRNKNKQISKALDEKEVLLKEIHHRVKNNLQVVSSLLSLQQRQTKDSNAQQALQEGRNRVKAMALIHQNLYQDNNLVGVDTQQYISKLVTNLVATYKTTDKSIEVNTNIDPLKLDVDTVIPLGLIINELISNSLKYAFINKNSGEISVALYIANNILALEVNDNGEGLPADFSIENSESLGYKLIRSFSQKLNAKLNLKSSEKGTNITLKINKFKTE